MFTSKGKIIPSSNWLALQKKLEPTRKVSSKGHPRREEGSQKRRKVEHDDTKTPRFARLPITSSQADTPSAGPSAPSPLTTVPLPTSHKNREFLIMLQQMILGHMEYASHQELPGKFLSLDCEMVGVGIEGAESSLARVSLVNFHGAVILDEFVRQKERVVDYRTQWSGIRESDMISAHKFEDIQKRVADLLQDRILVGHAVHNDLKALLLSHPRPQTRDTQFYAYRFGVVKSKRPALRNLVKQELGITIQSGEHSSVTDARATMAVYRLHKKVWERSSRPHPTVPVNPTPTPAPSQTSKKRKAPATSSSDSDSGSGSEADDSEGEESTSAAPPAPTAQPNSKGKVKAQPKSFPGGGRKGVSSGLSTIVRTGPTHKPKARSSGGLGARDASRTPEDTDRYLSRFLGAGSRDEWWKQLPGALPPAGGGGGGGKGSIGMSVRSSS